MYATSSIKSIYLVWYGSDLVQHKFMNGSDMMGSHHTKNTTSLRLSFIIVEIYYKRTAINDAHQLNISHKL